MPARSRLITLTASLSLAAGCSGGGEKQTPPEPPVVVAASRTIQLLSDGTCQEEVTVRCDPSGELSCNPPIPEPIPCPPRTLTHLERAQDGTCLGTYFFPACPPEADCAVLSQVTLDCPPLLAEDAEARAVRKNSSYGCSLETGEDSVPVDCPPEMEAPPAAGYRFVPLGDGLCSAVRQDIVCPPEMSCNPPPPERVRCPPGVE